MENAKRSFNAEVLSMREKKLSLLKHLEAISVELLDIQAKMEAAKKKPVPALPALNAEEIDRDPFEVSFLLFSPQNSTEVNTIISIL
jgi:hypothetical protein